MSRESDPESDSSPGSRERDHESDYSPSSPDYGDSPDYGVDENRPPLSENQRAAYWRPPSPGYPLSPSPGYSPPSPIYESNPPSPVAAENNDSAPVQQQEDEAEEHNERPTSPNNSPQEDGEAVQRTMRKKLLGSDDSDDDDDGEEKREGEVGQLMTNIFGESDEEDEKGEDRRDEEEIIEIGDEDEEGVGNRGEKDDNGMEWDFDVMLRNKKAEKTKKKKRRKDGGIDIINDDDGTVAYMVEAMKAAAKEDRHSNIERKPALKKIKMLNKAKAVLMKAGMVEALMDGGMMSAISEWLAPLPDKSLPALEIRTTLLKIMQGYGRIDLGILKQSGLAKAVMLLYKHPREVKPNKDMAAKLIREWARPIFQLETDYGSFTREEREQRDFDHMPAAKKQRRMSSDSAGPSSSEMGPAKKKNSEPKPGGKGFIMRARVPKPSTKDYVVRPKGTVAFEGEIKDRKGKASTRLDKAQRAFIERTKKSKAKRAIPVSLEGRNLAL